MVVSFTWFHAFRQNPHCEGTNRHRTLFNARVPAGRLVRHSIRVLPDFKYVISAGLAHGVSHGVEFTIYGDQKQRVNTIMVDDAAVIEDFQTIVSTSVYLANDSFAKLTRVGKVPFYLAPGDLPPLLQENLRGMSVNMDFQLAETAEEAKLEVAVDGQLSVFKILDRRVNEFGLTTLPHTVPLDSLAYVLSVAAHYYWYLGLTNKNNHVEHDVAVDFYALQLEYDDYGLELFVPVEPGFSRKDPNSDNPESNIIDFVVDSSAIYGIKLTNRTQWDLYLNAFLFNNSKLTIGEPMH